MAARGSGGARAVQAGQIQRRARRQRGATNLASAASVWPQARRDADAGACGSAGEQEHPRKRKRLEPLLRKRPQGSMSRHLCDNLCATRCSMCVEPTLCRGPVPFSCAHARSCTDAHTCEWKRKHDGSLCSDRFAGRCSCVRGSGWVVLQVAQRK